MAIVDRFMLKQFPGRDHHRVVNPPSAANGDNHNPNSAGVDPSTTHIENYSPSLNVFNPLLDDYTNDYDPQTTQFEPLHDNFFEGYDGYPSSNNYISSGPSNAIAGPSNAIASTSNAIAGPSNYQNTSSSASSASSIDFSFLTAFDQPPFSNSHAIVGAEGHVQFGGYKGFGASQYNDAVNYSVDPNVLSQNLFGGQGDTATGTAMGSNDSK